MGYLTPGDLVLRGRNLVTDVFIETGTHLGDTLNALAMPGLFNVYHSIELREEYHQKAKRRLKGRSDVHLHLGSSPEVLPRIIDPSRPTTFWLDAHYQGRNREEIDLSAGECPLMAELKVILGFQWRWLPIIIIDDAEMFSIDRKADQGNGLEFNFDQWPTTVDISRVLRRHGMENYLDRLYCLPDQR